MAGWCSSSTPLFPYIEYTIHDLADLAFDDFNDATRFDHGSFSFKVPFRIFTAETTDALESTNLGCNPVKIKATNQGPMVILDIHAAFGQTFSKWSK